MKVRESTRWCIKAAIDALREVRFNRRQIGVHDTGAIDATVLLEGVILIHQAGIESRTPYVWPVAGNVLDNLIDALEEYSTPAMTEANS